MIGHVKKKSLLLSEQSGVHPSWLSLFDEAVRNLFKRHANIPRDAIYCLKQSGNR